MMLKSSIAPVQNGLKKPLLLCNELSDLRVVERIRREKNASCECRLEIGNHSDKEWVRGDVHTNTMENVWSLFKRSIIGSYHQISVKHLDRYLDELEFRFNNRENAYLFRDTLIRLLNTSNLEYKQLIADKAA